MKKGEMRMDHCAVQVISFMSQMTRPIYVKTGIIPSNFNQNLCPWYSLYFLKNYSMGILWTSLYVFFAVITSTQNSKKKRERERWAHPCCECSKIRKTSPQHMLCAVINKLVYPGLSLYILANERETLFCCRQHAS